MPDDLDEAARDSAIARTTPSEPTRIEVWAKSAGRCGLCARYLVGDTGYFHTTLVGELAHITGATDGASSPRGASDLTATARAEASNLMLLCHECHRKVDSRGMWEYYSEDRLTQLKDQWEARVRSATDFSNLAPTLVLRLAAQIRGTMPGATDRQVSEALRSMHLRPGTEDARDARVDITLSDPESQDWVWERAASAIDEGVARVMERGASAGAGTLAVFAIGPIPVLIRLGYALDDKSDVRVMGASRRDNDSRWMWIPDPAPAIQFEASSAAPDPGAEDILVVVSVSASVDQSLLPAEVANLPLVSLISTPQGPESIKSEADLRAFGIAWRELVARAEQDFPGARRFHVIAAVPAAAAVEIGRAYMRDSQPELLAYQRTSDSYFAALSIS